MIRGIPDTFFPTVRPARRAAPAAPTSKPTRKPFRLSTARFAPPSPKPTVTTISKCSLLQLTTHRDAEAGWCSVYPQDFIKPRKLALAVSESLDVPVLLLDVYDSDSCEVVLYNAGKLVTRFVNAYEDRPREPGNALRFAKYANDRDEASIRSVLDLEPVFAEDIAIGLAAYFGISRERVLCGFPWFKDDAPERVGLVLAPG